MTDSVKCENCGTTNNIETHHIRYIPERTVKLCKSCHERAHSKRTSEFHPEQEASELFDASNDDRVPDSASASVKQINNNSYFYWNWREGSTIRSEYICSVSEASNTNLDEFGAETDDDQQQTLGTYQ